MPEIRKLAAIMFTDIVGYTSLMEEDEKRAFQLLEKNRKVHKPIIKKYRGKWLKEMGDGILASFQTISNAVYCAIEIQETCKNEPDLKLRIGIHQGEVTFQGDDVFGSGVNIASRLEEIAPIGSIYVSESVFRNIQNQSAIKAEFIGEESLKNVKHSVKVYEVLTGQESLPIDKQYVKKSKYKIPFLVSIGLLIIAISFFLIWLTEPINTSTSIVQNLEKSIAVLPFTNDSPDQENEYFCNGMMEEILNQLEKISALKVKSRTSVEQYRNPTKNIKTIAGELGVSFLVEGSVRKIGDDIRIHTQLIDGRTGDHLWSDVYDGKYNDQIFKFQSDVAKRISESLYANIQPEELKKIEKPPTSNIVSYDNAKKGWYYLKLFQTSGDKRYLTNAEELFKKVVALDSNYIDGYSGLASIYQYKDSPDSAIVYAEKVIQLDPDNSDGYYRRASYFWMTVQPDKAIPDFKKAIELTPISYYVYLNLGMVYISLKEDVRNGIKYINKAFEIAGETNPQIDPFMLSLSGIAFSDIGEYERAEKYFREALDWQVGCRGIWDLSGILIRQGEFEVVEQFLDSACQKMECQNVCNRQRFILNVHTQNWDEAKRYYNLSIEISEIDEPYSLPVNLYWAYVLRKTGESVKADSIAQQELLRIQSRSYLGFNIYHISSIYAFLNQKEKSLQYLREFESLERSFRFYDYILIDPMFENLRDDPEFLEIVDKAQKEKAEIREEVKQLEREGLL